MASVKTESRQTIPQTDRVVCRCFRVTEIRIREAIDLYGSSSVSDVTQQTNAGAGCNGCHCRIKRMLAGKGPTCGVFEVCDACGFNSQCCDCKVA